MKMTTMIMTSTNPSIAKGIGNDIIEIARIQQSIHRYGKRFLTRIFTDKEIAYCQKHVMHVRHFAGRFAAKEAIAKALGCGIGKQLSWKDLEILNDTQGKPVVFLHPQKASLFQSPTLLLSISHCKAYATAVAIWI